jgi:hypothetical protein
MITRLVLIPAVFAVAMLGRSQAADITGQWKASFDTQIGVQKYVYEFKTEGAKITGKASFERENGKGEIDLKEIKLAGDDISFMEPFGFDGQEIRIDYQGKVSGDEMKLTRRVGEFATEQVVARRAQTPAAPSAPAKAAERPPPK